jgi:hypothetical protein
MLQNQTLVAAQEPEKSAKKPMCIKFFLEWHTAGNGYRHWNNIILNINSYPLPEINVEEGKYRYCYPSITYIL